MPEEMSRILRAGLAYGWGRKSVRLLMLGSCIQGGFTMWGWYAWQPYFLDLLGEDAPWVAGVVAALVALSTIVGNSVVEVFTRHCGKRTTLMLWSAGVLSAAAVGIGFAGSFWVAVALLLVATGSMGVGEPVKQAYLHDVTPSQERATVVSFDSLLESAGGIGGQLGLGYVARAESIAVGYVTGGLALALSLPVLAALRALHEPADVIVGREPGRRGPCAAQGTPEVSQMDSTPRQPVATA